jgi:hypothetical protein
VAGVERGEAADAGALIAQGQFAEAAIALEH